MTHSSDRREGQPAEQVQGSLKTAPGGPPPLLDESVLGRLKEELDDLDYASTFFESYIDFLPQRIDRLRSALVNGNVERALDAALSLKSSSQMIGARQLAVLSATVEATIRAEGNRAGGAALPQYANLLLAAIRQCGTQTCQRLRAYC